MMLCVGGDFVSASCFSVSQLGEIEIDHNTGGKVWNFDEIFMHDALMEIRVLPYPTMYAPKEPCHKRQESYKDTQLL